MPSVVEIKHLTLLPVLADEIWRFQRLDASFSSGGLTVLLHDLQEASNDLRSGADHDLTLASLLGVVHALESIVEDGGADHLDGLSG